MHLLQGHTALHLAAATRHQEAIRVLLSLEADVNRLDPSVSFLTFLTFQLKLTKKLFCTDCCYLLCCLLPSLSLTAASSCAHTSTARGNRVLSITWHMILSDSYWHSSLQ